ncbi:acyl-CoA/acyl-ACP dehydrogenase [Iamia sp. SCSIO 61187]|uniref:acyl-CoA dehydrogenase family protein n=1 Tax=Iamia sp. SCSIO 61187 TaxID=2722752 RepID=UPI001C62BF6D|nr:acyl-CoA dehydrogenase family protein [Iamia sp. SCSIO 61187]QYG93618.1 acyl-CoA/acyl-ACP dehydrogenase [Iamia sp. SCSIO 61187]
MDFARTEEQDEIAGLAGTILADLVTVDRLKAVEGGDADGDATGDRFDREVWRALADAGLLGVGLPADLGGSGLGIVEQCLVLEQVGRTVAPVPVLASCVLGALPIATYGSAAQRSRWVPGAVTGETILTAALVEPANRWPEHPTTTATGSVDAGWRLTGTKTCVPAGTVADAIVVSATGEDGSAGLFLVEAGADGMAVEAQRVTNRDLEAQITLDGVAAELLTDDPGALPWLVERATVALCAQAAGVVVQALEMTAAYTKERVQFDRPIATFQAVGQRAADAYIDVEATRLVLWQAAWRLAEGLPASTEVQVAKYWAAEAAHRVGHTAVHLHGGTGVDVDHPIHRYLIAARELELTLGGATDQLLRIGAALAATRE